MSLSSSRPISLLTSVYAKAPATCSLIISYALSTLATNCYLDYKLFLSLGGGGPLPHNFAGWLVHSLILRPLSLSRYWTTQPRYLPSKKGVRSGYLGHDSISQRPGSRPRTQGVAPHRQVEQKAESKAELEQAILNYFDQISHAFPSHILSSSSRLEPSSKALFSLTHMLVTQSNAPSRSTRSAAFPSDLSRLFLSSLKGGEFCHVHSSSNDEGRIQDGSLHMVLHPDDANLLIEKGWAELHPLAGCPSYSGFWVGWPAWLVGSSTSQGTSQRWWWGLSGWLSDDAGSSPRKVIKKMGLPPTYVMVYAPRDEQDLEMIKVVIRASVKVATGLKREKDVARLP